MAELLDGQDGRPRRRLAPREGGMVIVWMAAAAIAWAIVVTVGLVTGLLLR